MQRRDRRENGVLISLLLVLALMLLASAPIWPYSREWGFYPSTGIGIILIAVVLLAALHVF